MSNFVLDLETAQKLRDAGQCLELRDRRGAVVGYFRPVVRSGGLPKIREVVHQGRVGSLCQ